MPYLTFLNAEFFSLPSGSQTVWIQIRPDILSGLDLDPNCLQRLSADDKSHRLRAELNTEQVLDTDLDLSDTKGRWGGGDICFL